MKILPLYPRSFTRIFWFAALIALAAASLRATAQQTAPAAQPAATSAQSATPAAAETAKPAEGEQSGESEEEAFLHAPIVKSVARILHLDLDTTVNILLGINFAVIFFAIVIPLGKLMPKVFRKRSQTVRHDLETARAATADAQARLHAVEAKLAGLGEEIEKFRAQAGQESLEDEKRIKAALEEESARIVASAEQEIDVAVAHAKRGLRDFAADLAVEQASQQLKLTPETDRALITEFLTGVAAGSGKGEKN